MQGHTVYESEQYLFVLSAFVFHQPFPVFSMRWALRLIHFLSVPSFFPVRSGPCPHLLITHPRSSSHSDFRPLILHPFPPASRSISAPFIPVKWNTTLSTVSLCMIHVTRSLPAPRALIHHVRPLCFSALLHSHPRRGMCRPLYKRWQHPFKVFSYWMLCSGKVRATLHQCFSC